MGDGFAGRSQSVDFQQISAMGNEGNAQGTNSMNSSFLARRKNSQQERRKTSLSTKGYTNGDFGDQPVDLLSPTSDRMKNSFIITNGATKNIELYRKAQASRKSIFVKEELQTSEIHLHRKETPEERERRVDEARCRSLLLNCNKVINFMICREKRPSAREGHTGLIYYSEGSDNVWLLIFGGDRHGMPFNDLHMLDLNNEFIRAGIY